LNQHNRTNQHPRQAFIADLIKSIQVHQALHHDIIIGGDFNETTDKHNSGILKLVTTTNLVDPFLHYHPTLPTFNT
jgi:exonuclease III